MWTAPQHVIERMTKIVKVACPYCGAAIGELCCTKHGAKIMQIGQVHDARLSPNKKPSKRAMQNSRRMPHRMKCEECGKNYADPPSRLCPGCEAYREHQPNV
jgi:ribosomal protein L32